MWEGLSCKGLLPFLPGFWSPTCSCCTPAAPWLRPAHGLGERQWQVGCRSTSPALMPLVLSRCAEWTGTLSPPPASPPPASPPSGAGVQLPRAGSELLLWLGFHSGKHLARTCIFLKPHRAKHRVVTPKHNTEVLFSEGSRGS